jgi:hypothetical protein
MPDPITATATVQTGACTDRDAVQLRGAFALRAIDSRAMPGVALRANHAPRRPVQRSLPGAAPECAAARP